MQWLGHTVMMKMVKRVMALLTFIKGLTLTGCHFKKIHFHDPLREVILDIRLA